MDLASLIGLLGGSAVVVYGMLSGGSISGYIHKSSLIITMGGGLVCTMMSYPLSDTIRAYKLIPLIFKSARSSAIETIHTMVELSQKARREGLLALESSQNDIKEEIGDYKITYIVEDSSGNKTMVTRNVKILDKKKILEQYI